MDPSVDFPLHQLIRFFELENSDNENQGAVKSGILEEQKLLANTLKQVEK